ncbi:MAG: hypothetical protein JWQ32_2060 [Marmoricola sp.]|nr:hypothetical protein [Marmoricola sp.]
MRNIVRRLVVASCYFSVVVVAASTFIAIEAIQGDEAEAVDTPAPLTDG